MALNYPDVVGVGFHLREMNIGKYDAEGGTRTPMRSPSHGPEPCVSANSTTSALLFFPAGKIIAASIL